MIIVVTFKPIYSAVSSSARQGSLVPMEMLMLRKPQLEHRLHPPGPAFTSVNPPYSDNPVSD